MTQGGMYDSLRQHGSVVALFMPMCWWKGFRGLRYYGFRPVGYVQFRKREDARMALQHVEVDKSSPFGEVAIVLRPTNKEFDVMKVYEWLDGVGFAGEKLPRVSPFVSEEKMVFATGGTYWDRKPAEFPENEGRSGIVKQVK